MASPQNDYLMPTTGTVYKTREYVPTDGANAGYVIEGCKIDD